MKTILIILISSTLSIGASAQHRGGGHFGGGHTRIYVSPGYGYGLGFGFGYPYYGYPFFGYPYGYGFFPYGNGRMSSYTLNRQIASIKTQYRYKIKAARKDKSMTSSQRKQQVLLLKSDREKAINNAEANFRRQRMNYRQRMNSNQNPGTNNPDMNNNQNPNNNYNNQNQNNNQNNNQNSGTGNDQNS